MITHYIELSCDHEDCTNAYGASPTELTSLQATRVGSMVHGWTRAGDLDLCPDHRREDQVDAVRRLVGERLTDAQIGQRLGLNGTAVQKIRQRHGIAAGLGRVGRPSKVGGAR